MIKKDILYTSFLILILLFLWTPQKIYSFLKSGKPLVATNLWTHTQVLSPKNSVLVDPNPQSLAEGICFALWNSEAQKRSRAAKELAEKEYTYPRYLEKVSKALEKASSGR